MFENDVKDDGPSNSVVQAIQTMQLVGTCCSPVHWHSFRGARPLSFRRLVCVACQQPISIGFDLLSTPTAVQCVACSVFAHRSCAANPRLWNENTFCQVNRTEAHSTDGLAVSVAAAAEKNGDQASNASENNSESPSTSQSINELTVSEPITVSDPLTFSDDEGTTSAKVPEQTTAKATCFESSNPGTPDDEAATSAKVPEQTTTKPTSPSESSKSGTPKRNNGQHRAGNYPGLRMQQKSKNRPTSTSPTVEQTEAERQERVMDPIDYSWEVTVAAIAGGVAGLVVAGPVGLAGGAIAAAAARQQQSQRRKLLLHNGVSVGVRPNVPTDPIWHNYVAQAVRTAPNNRKSPMHADITSVAESEIATPDKILLLVHRTLNNAHSRSGHMYRYLMAIYRDRAKQPCTDSRRRRGDVQAIVRHVTASLLEEWPQMGASWTEVTAANVESLVFGQLYDSVMEEIVEETSDRDVELWSKISDVQQETGHCVAKLLEGSVSDKAIQALQMLPKSHSATEKLHFLVVFLDCVSQHIMETEGTNCSADSLLKAVCQHVLYLNSNIRSYAEMAFLEEFSRDEALRRGREGYALVTLQACLGFLQVTNDIKQTVVDDGALE